MTFLPKLPSNFPFNFAIFLIHFLIISEWIFAAGSSANANTGPIVDPNEYDVIVIGAGIIGSSIGYQLSLGNKRTLILEKEDRLQNVQGSSHGGSRIIRYTHDDELWLPLVHDAFWEWQKLESVVGKEGKLLIKNGILLMETNRDATLKRAEILHKFGIKGHFWHGSNVSRHFPHMQNYGSDWCAIYEPGGGTLRANHCVQTIQDEFMRHGGKIHDLEKVEKIIHFDDHVMVRSRKVGRDGLPLMNGTTNIYTAKKVVVAAGAWLNSILGKDLPIKTSPQFVGTYFWKIPNSTALRKYFNPFPTHNKHPPSPTVMLLNSPLEKNKKNGIPKASLYAIPALDYAGEIKFGVSYRGEQIEGKIPRNGERIEHSWMWQIPQGHLKHHWPHVDYSELAHRTTCLYTMTPDEMFLVDRHPTQRNLFVAGGFSGAGFKYGLTIGKMVAQLMNGIEEPKIHGFNGEQPFKQMDFFSLSRRIQKQNLH